MNLNQFVGIGRLVKDPELKETPSGNTVCTFTLAISNKYTDKNGKKQENTDFLNCVAWGKIGELIEQYMTKGSILCVNGRVATRTYDNKKGEKRYVTEIVVNGMQFGPNKNRSEDDEEDEEDESEEEEAEEEVEEDEDEEEEQKPKKKSKVITKKGKAKTKVKNKRSKSIEDPENLDIGDIPF